MMDVYEQMLEGWYGDLEQKGQTGGWKVADCGKLFRHAIGDMNGRIAKDEVLSGKIGSRKAPD